MKSSKGRLLIMICVCVLLFLCCSLGVYGDTTSNTGAGYALNFSGTPDAGPGDFVNIPNSSSLTLTTTFTVEAWINPTQYGYGHVVSKALDEPTGNDREWNLEFSDSGTIETLIYYDTTLGYYYARSTTNISLNVWTHVAGVYDGSSIYTYINGQLAAITADTSPIPNTGVSLTIGNDFSDERPFNGVIDEVRVWNIARNQSQIQSMMNCPLVGNESGLVGYWRLDEGSGQIAYDASGNGNNGQLGSTATTDSNDPTWVVSDAPLNCSGVIETSNDWPMFAHDINRSGLSPDNILNPPLVQKWVFNPGLNANSQGIAVVGNKVYAGIGNNLYALDTETGSTIWMYTGGGTFDDNFGVIDDVIYVGSTDGKLYAIDANSGNLISYYTTGGWVRGTPTAVNAIAYFTSFDGNIYAATTSNLSPIWSYSIGGESNLESGPAIANGVVYVGGGNYLWAFEADTGTLHWNRSLGSTVNCTPAIVNDLILTGSQTGIYAVETSNGNVIWNQQIGIVNYPPVISGNTAFVAVENGNVYALALSTGSTIWEQSIPAGFGGYIIGANGSLYITTGSGRGFATIKMSDGTSGRDAGPNNVPAIANGTYYETSSNGNVYALVSQSTTTTSQNPPPSGAGNALSFNGPPDGTGPGDVVEVPDSPSLSFSSTITVECWIKPNRIYDSSVFVTKDDGNTNREFILQQELYSSNLQLIILTSPSNYGYARGGLINTDIWQHVAGVYDGSSIYVYLNGVLTGSSPFTGSIAQTSVPLTIGNWFTLDRPFDGTIDEVRVWNIARSQSEIQSTMNCSLNGNETGLVGYWRLDEGSGQIAYDASGHGNNGQLGSTATTDSNDPTWVVSDAPLTCNSTTTTNNPLPFIDFLVASDTGRFVYQVPPNLAGAGQPTIGWLPSYNGESGVLEIIFTAPYQGINMTLEESEWFNSDSGQWYLLKAQVESSIAASNTLSVGGILFNGVPPAETDMNADVLISLKPDWAILRSEQDSYTNNSMYPQLMIRNNNYYPATVYIDYIQVKQIAAPTD